MLDRTVECWGENGSGQLGDGTRNDRSRPVAVGGLADVAMVAAGAAHTCGGTAEIAAGASGTCMISEMRTKIGCWGDGDGQPREQYYPTGGYLDIVVGDHFGCVRYGGPRVCWGDAEFGSGTGSLSLTKLSAGDAFVCGLTTSNSVYCWGDNTKGQLGALDTDPKAEGASVANLGPVSAFSAGAAHACAALDSSDVVCWGDNSSEQLGNEGAGLGAVMVAGVGNALDVAAGGGHSCALIAGGSVSCWGSNTAGQLGDGSNESRALAAPVEF